MAHRIVPVQLFLFFEEGVGEERSSSKTFEPVQTSAFPSATTDPMHGIDIENKGHLLIFTVEKIYIKKNQKSTQTNTRQLKETCDSNVNCLCVQAD